MLKFILVFICIFHNLSGAQHYMIDDEKLLIIDRADCYQEIDYMKCLDVMVRSFMNGYEDVPLSELNPNFKSTGDVRRFYENYFSEEVHHFSEGKLHWVTAHLNGRLVGFATFELEDKNTAYMNLLTVDPRYQGKGIGEKLTFYICSKDMFPQVNTIKLLIRNVNVSGYKFYKKIGFVDFDYNRRDNFVDMSLLKGMKWERN